MCPIAVQLHKFRFCFTISVVQSVNSTRILWLQVDQFVAIRTDDAKCPFYVRVETTFFPEYLSILAPVLYTFPSHLPSAYSVTVQNGTFVCPSLCYISSMASRRGASGNFRLDFLTTHLRTVYGEYTPLSKSEDYRQS